MLLSLTAKWLPGAVQDGDVCKNGFNVDFCSTSLILFCVVVCGCQTTPRPRLP